MTPAEIAAVLIGSAGLVVAVAVLIGALLGRTVKAEVGSVRAEFRNNGGSTLRDAIDRIEKRQIGIEETVTSLAERVTVLEHPKPAPRAPRKKAS